MVIQPSTQIRSRAPGQVQNDCDVQKNNKEKTMVDLAATLNQFQEALSQKLINPKPCAAYEHLHMLIDSADGVERVTFARIVDGTTQALVAFVPVDPYKNLVCLNVGLAVVPELRGHGLGTQCMQEALSEVQPLLAERGVLNYYIEAVASIHNAPSNRICNKILSSSPSKIVCQVSGEDAFQYIKRYH